MASPPGQRPARLTVTPSSRANDRSARGLRPVSALPRRAKAFLVVAALAIVGFAAWVTVRLLQVDGLALAIVLIALSYLGAIVVGVAVLTLTRVACSLGAVPYLLGRGLRRLLAGR